MPLVKAQVNTSISTIEKSIQQVNTKVQNVENSVQHVSQEVQRVESESNKGDASAAALAALHPLPMIQIIAFNTWQATVIIKMLMQ